MDQNQSVSGVTTICLMQCDTSPLHRVDQAVVDCGLWNVVLLGRNCWILAGTGTLSYRSIQSIPNLLNGWHVWVCRPWKKCVAVRCHAEETWGDGGGWVARQWTSGTRHGISAFKFPLIQCNSVRCPSLMPAHNPTATMGHSVHNVDISKRHTRGLRLRGRLDVLPNSQKWYGRMLMVDKLTLNSLATALVDILAVSMQTALSKTWEICGIVLCDKTAHFRVAFCLSQHKVHLCNDNAV